VEPLSVAGTEGEAQCGGMTISSLRITAILATAFALAGCASYKSGMGDDPLSHSEAELVTWNDGGPAVAIQCSETRGCGQRARAICMSRGLKILQRAIGTEANAAVEEDGRHSHYYMIVRCG
jgi:hypothetical protein